MLQACSSGSIRIIYKYVFYTYSLCDSVEIQYINTLTYPSFIQTIADLLCVIVVGTPDTEMNT